MSSLPVVALVILLLIAVTAFYVAAEFAAVGSRRTRVSEMAREGSGLAKGFLPILQDRAVLDRYIAACQVGITLSSIVLGFYSQAQLTPRLSPWLGSVLGLQNVAALSLAATLVLIGLTLFHVIFGELLPKSIAVRFPEQVALTTFLPMRWSLWLLRPFISLLNGSAFAMMRALRLTGSPEHSHVHSPDELERVFSESAKGGLIDAGEREMLRNALRLESHVARQIMIPRTRMAAVALSSEPAPLLKKLANSPHTRFPVFEESIDSIKGVIHFKDLFLFAQQHPQGNLREIIREVVLLPESMTVGDMWREMRDSGHHLAIIFDEYGGTAGMVTLEDIVEEVFGELQDEFDRETELVSEDDEGRIFLRGDVLISSVNDKLLINLPDEDTDTVGGLVLELLERSPEVGDEVTVQEDLALRVEAVRDYSVSRVSLMLPNGNSKEASESVMSEGQG